jgi:uncharacterized membrane protein YqiK
MKGGAPEKRCIDCGAREIRGRWVAYECYDCDLNKMELVKLQRQLKEQEDQFRAAHAEFSRVAAELASTNGQIRRSLVNAQEEVREARAEEQERVQLLLEGERELAESQRQGLLGRIQSLEAEISRLKGLAPAPKEEEKVEGTRFSLLEVD